MLAALFLVPMLSVPMLETGCKTTPSATSIAYQTLATVGATVDASAKIVAAAQVAGKVTPQQAAQFASLHTKFLASYNAAVDIAAAASTTGLNMPAPADLTALANDLTALVASFNIK